MTITIQDAVYRDADPVNCWWHWETRRLFARKATRFGFHWWRRTSKWDGFSTHCLKIGWLEIGLHRSCDWCDWTLEDIADYCEKP